MNGFTVFPILLLVGTLGTLIDGSVLNHRPSAVKSAGSKNHDFAFAFEEQSQSAVTQGGHTGSAMDQGDSAAATSGENKGCDLGSDDKHGGDSDSGSKHDGGAGAGTSTLANDGSSGGSDDKHGGDSDSGLKHDGGAGADTSTLANDGSSGGGIDKKAIKTAAKVEAFKLGVASNVTGGAANTVDNMAPDNPATGSASNALRNVSDVTGGLSKSFNKVGRNGDLGALFSNDGSQGGGQDC